LFCVYVAVCSLCARPLWRCLQIVVVMQTGRAVSGNQVLPFSELRTPRSKKEKKKRELFCGSRLGEICHCMRGTSQRRRLIVAVCAPSDREGWRREPWHPSSRHPPRVSRTSVPVWETPQPSRKIQADSQRFDSWSAGFFTGRQAPNSGLCALNTTKVCTCLHPPTPRSLSSSWKLRNIAYSLRSAPRQNTQTLFPADIIIPMVTAAQARLIVS